MAISRVCWLFILAVVHCAPPEVWAQGRPSPTNDSLAAAAEIGEQVQKALVKANAAGLGGLRLQKATLSLETGSAVEGGVKLNFIIFTISNTQKKGRTLTTTLTFGALDRLHAGGRPNLANLSDSLSQVIASAAAVATEVEVLRLAEATVKIEFAVEKKGGGGLAIKILGAELDGSIDFEKVSKNSLEVVFSR